MKSTLNKLLIILFIVVSTTACEKKHHPQSNCPPEDQFDNFDKLHYNITPTKPIKVPDTMQVKTFLNDTYKLRPDTIVIEGNKLLE